MTLNELVKRLNQIVVDNSQQSALSTIEPC
jgi:hypothetical protein